MTSATDELIEAAKGAGGIGRNEGMDPFSDLSKLRVSQDFAAAAGTEKIITKIPVGKPHKQWWSRVRPESDFRIETVILEIKEKNEIYLVAPELWSLLADETTRAAIFTGINRQGVLFLWPVKLPGADGRHNPWHLSSLAAATTAQDCWIRMTANQPAGAYDIVKSVAKLDDPKWPNVCFNELLRTAFAGRYIDSLEHPVLKELRGEV